MRSKGARLYLRAASGTKPATWIIRDGGHTERTGCREGERAQAEQRLADYIAAKYTPARTRDRAAAQIEIDDVLNIYLADVAVKAARPKEVGQRMLALLEFFGGHRLDFVTGPTCRDYAVARGSQSMARRELEDLRAAIKHHRKEGLCKEIVEVVLPEKSQPRDRWLTRGEAARMIWAAWRYREVQKGVPTDRRSRRHIARFILVGLYTGTRAGAICAASLTPAVGRGYVDLAEGVFNRRAQGARETKKRQPPIRLPPELVAHMRRWQAAGVSKHAVVEFNGKPLKSVRKAFANVAADAKVEGATPHVLRHTAVTWAMQGGADLWDSADFFGMTVEVLERVYGHHRPDSGKGVHRALRRR